MRWLKFLLYAVSALLLLTVASTVVVIMIFDDNKIRDTLISAVEENTDARLSIAGDFSVKLSINPTISVTNLALRSTSDEYVIDAGELTVRISLFSFLSGPLRIMELRLNDVNATVKYDDKTKAAADPSVEHQVLDGLLPDIDRVSFGNFVFRLVNQEAVTVQHIRFDKLDLARNEANRFLMLRGTGEIAGRVYRLSGQMGTIRDMVNPMSPFPLELQIKGKEYSFTINGVINQPLQGRGFDLAVQGNVSELSDLIDYNPDKREPLGQLEGSMNLRGDVPDIRLEEVKLSLKQGGDIHMELQNDSVNPDTWGESGLQIKGYINDPKVLNWLLPYSLPSFQHTNLTATLFRKNKDFTIEGIDIQAKTADVAMLELKGEIGLGDTAESGLIKNMDLALRFSSTKTETIMPFLFDEMPEIGQTSGTLRLLIKSGVLSIENLELKAGSKNTLQVNVTGQINNMPVSDKSGGQTVDLKLIVTANNTRLLEPVFKVSLPEVRDIRFEGHLTGSSDDLKLDKIDLVASQSKKLKIKTQGIVRFGGKAGISNGVSAEQAINLDVQLSTSDSQSLSAWTGKEVPALGPVKAKMRVSGSFDHVEINKARVEVGNKKDFWLVARGQIGAIDLKQGAKLQSTEMQLQLNASSLQALPGFTSYKLPSFGKVSGSARITSKGDSYKLDKIELITGDRKNPALRVKGSILDPFALLGIELQLDVDAAVYDLLTTYFNPGIRDLGRVKGKLLLSDKDGPLGIYGMNVTAGKKQAYSLKVSGDVGDIMRRDERDAEVELSVQDWTLVEKLLNRPLPAFAPMHSKGRLFAKKNTSRFDGETSMGKTQITTKLSIDYAGKKPRLTGSIVSPGVNLSDIGVVPKSVDSTKTKKTDTQDNKARIFTADPFSLQALGMINGELQIKVDKIQGTDLSYSSLEMKIALNDSKLRIFPARFVFTNGAVETDFSINASKSPASYKLNIVADDVDLEAVALQFQKQPVAVKGNMDVIVDLTANGDSARAVASSLDGKIGLVGENISLLRSYVELLMRDVLSWTFSSFGLREQYAITNCGIIRLTARQGLLSSDLIVLDGPNMNLMSELKLNLRDETIDMVLNPKKKNRIFSSVSPVQIKGPLRDPDVEALSASEVASGYGGLVFIPQVFIPLKALDFLGVGVTDDGTDEQSPCLDIGKTKTEAGK